MPEESLREKLSGTVMQLCDDLGVPYDPTAGPTDPRAQMIANALTWYAAEAVKAASAPVVGVES